MADSLVKFFKVGIERSFAAGEVILYGEEPTGVIYIKEGYVAVYSISDEGHRYLHVIYKPGEIFPLIWVFKNLHRRVFYEAVTAVSVLEMPKNNFLNLVQRNLSAANEVLAQLAEQFSIYADRLDNLQYKSAKERLVYRLLFLASRFGEQQGSKIIIKAPVTHELIAQSVNLVRETVSREIEELEKQNIISRHRSHIVINDITELARQFSEPVSLDLWGLSAQNT